MLSFKIYFYAVETPDGNIHVQNYVGIYRGQHHVHSKKGFKKWLRENDLKVDVVKGKCDCGLKPGDIKEYDGVVWHNPRFE
jgi:hypothetical protein